MKRTLIHISVVDNLYKGTLHHTEDVDWYIFDTTTNAFNVTFSIDPNTAFDDVRDGWRLDIYPYGSASPLIYYYDITNECTSFDIPYKGKILLKVTSDFVYASPIDCIYNLKVTPHSASELWETENNNSFEKATVINTGKSYWANLENASDADYFKYVAPCYGVLKLDFASDLADNVGNGWDVSVVESDGTVLYTTNVRNDLNVTQKDIPVKKGTAYYVKVTPNFYYSSPTRINYKVGVTFTAKTDNVTNLKATQTTSSIKLTWNKVAGAKGYKVYKYNTSTKKYTLLKTTTANSYQISNLKAGTAYTYYVKAYQIYNNKHINSGKYTKLATATKPKLPTNFKTSSRTATSITLKWNKVTGASGYRLYRYNSTTKKWVAFKSVTGTSTTIKQLKAGTTYYYKVQAYKTAGSKNIYGETTKSLKTTTRPAKVILNSLTTSTGKITVKWNKLSQTTGYVIEYSTSKSFSKKETVTVSKKSTVSKTIKGLKSNKTYYVRVRSYKTIDGTKYYGTYSSVKKIKVK